MSKETKLILYSPLEEFRRADKIFVWADFSVAINIFVKYHLIKIHSKSHNIIFPLCYMIFINVPFIVNHI